MITEMAEVLRIEGNKILVRINPAQGCAGCAQKSGCGTGMLQSWLNPVQRMWVPIESDLQERVEAGQWVELCVEEGGFVRSSVLVFLLPMLGLVLGAWVGQNLGQDATAVLGGIAGLLGSAGLVRLVRQRHAELLVGVPGVQLCKEPTIQEPSGGASVQA